MYWTQRRFRKNRKNRAFYMNIICEYVHVEQVSFIDSSRVTMRVCSIRTVWRNVLAHESSHPEYNSVGLKCDIGVKLCSMCLLCKCWILIIYRWGSTRLGAGGNPILPHNHLLGSLLSPHPPRDSWGISLACPSPLLWYLRGNGGGWILHLLLPTQPPAALLPQQWL